MRRKHAALLGALLVTGAIAFAQAEPLAPPPGIVVDGVPPIDSAIAAALEPYGAFHPHGMLSWHPRRREILVRRRLHATNQVYRVSEPGAPPVPLTDFADAVNAAWYQPTTGAYFLFLRAEGGNEAYRIHRHDMASGADTTLGPEGERAESVAWNRKGNRIVYTTRTLDRNHPGQPARTELHVMNPLAPASDRVIARLAGGGWFAPRFSEDGRRVVFVEYVSANESRLWVVDVASGRKRRITPRGAAKVSYGEARFARDGKGVFTTSDRGNEFKRLVYLPLGGGRERVLTPKLAYDVDDFEVSFDAGLIAFTTNERGSDVLRFIDLATLKELPRPPLLHGVIGGLQWRPGSREVAFHVSSARSAGDVFSYDVKTNQVTRWTNGNSPGINVRDFAEPSIVAWKSFDGLEVSGLLYRPPERFGGRRPVIIDIHGGPESQARARFIGRNNYLVNELGVAIIYPNVRGSSGFGKTFLALDDGMKREDPVKDIGALLDWIARQPDLDAGRVLVIGGSYGGYMALACAERYAERIAGAQSVVGISNFVTFLGATEGYRRDLRRAEYGDERQAAMRAFLLSISPLTHVEKITKPLFVVCGLNDPRVPPAEAAQLVAALKARSTPVWSMSAKDEGHGFAKKPNADFLFYATVEFVKRTLLLEPAPDASAGR